ncbi:GIY-YIG nuclease family protein [Agrobacterium tumefaciens]|jgi:hypothetical protein|uniref:Bacteriophage T5 Orf172 DNA-binding domain-containing protein n=1 Tax=Agrobacterium tumefaciens TaxID=358 RepID=A0AA44EZ67_AGRTU|nr:GIY-YIG nuclease family protein [Agrobacterium tumefaciens]NSL23064.1 hypothetical protein [Agrobacterium tumefaciens]NTB89651.1 hypothetical protein [Agrobacterium tumefaciens]NTC15481.1 hypothetical protein [Agrobacterium tumefaciens]NTC26565.1 hypothetical protein [Agrobacterium tumefaciens]NTC58153.1 hypothetical protein [Agrobacterium tumefaciens]
MAEFGRNGKFALFNMATSMRTDSEQMRLSPEEMKAAQRTSELASIIDLAQSMTGPGFPLDRKLREFIREFNNRVMMARGDEQPQSFDVLQAFVEPHERALLLKILPEVFYSLDLNGILDKLTDPTRVADTKQLLSLREGVIYHVNIPGSYQGLRFVGNDNLAFYGAAFVRHGDELSIIGVAAKDGREKGLEPVDFNDGDLDPDREFLRMNRESINRNHAEFYEGDTLYPIVFLTRIDLVRKTTMVRFILEEMEELFEVYSDSRDMYTYMSKVRKMALNEVSKIFDTSHEQLTIYSQVFTMLWDIPYSVLDLESDDDLTINRYPTELNIEKNSTNVRKIRKVLTLQDAPNYVDVKSIIKLAADSKSYDWKAEAFKVEQSGYWKALGPGKVGVGKNGDTVHGRTWVTVKESWAEALGFEPPEASNNLQVTVTTDAADVGIVYVMRSASHPKDQYKVGFTVKDVYDRANQLYSTSGQSDQFNVIQHWKVRAPRRVEALVHQKLAPYRVNPRREFFSLKYEKIRLAIEDAIQELAAQTPDDGVHDDS